MPRGTAPHARQGEEPQRVMGMPTDWIGPVDPRLKSLKNPIRAYREWRLHKRLGSYAPDEDKVE
jgi:hypothetical protein